MDFVRRTVESMADANDGWILPPAVERLTGSEQFAGVDATVRDFWRFALGDLRMNNARGYLAEFLVARALGLTDPVRIEWAEHDICFDGITIEVKSSAYLQAWEQRQLSRINFSGLKGTPYTPRGGYDPAGKQFNAQVYVFGVQTATVHDRYDPLDVTQWEWFVLPRQQLAQLDQSTLSLATLRALTAAIGFHDLESAVRAAATGDRPRSASGIQEVPLVAEDPSQRG